MAIEMKQMNLRNWTSVPPGDLDLNGNAADLHPTGEGKECVAQKRRDGLEKAVRKISFEPGH
ncbi:hypothetical protein [Rhizobium sp. BK176]|uniref:hypothetical protein n=1 Tax=Rhizobium sp. BK176 TaxID=2587071 RepID=UPI002167D00F|nr:hypothetical protein [Rhizobium sp. BK176]MCS4088793.1 hypothetical protein [Rhizobium sp. BK176]